jgi:tetratricopeptide (TPR) repeat protein
MRQVVTVTALCVLFASVLGAQDKLAERQRQESREHYHKGESLMMEESFEKAAAEFRMATRLDPQYTMAFYSLGKASMVLKRYDEAAAAYEACRETLLDLSSLDVETRGKARQERVDELREIEAVIQRWGGPEAPPGMTIMRLMERKRLLEQQEERDSIRNVGIPAELSIALGSAYFRLGRQEDATREYLAAIDAGDTTGTAHNNVAVIFMMEDRLDDARAHLALAEAAGFRPDPRFKQDLEKRSAAVEQ